MTHHLNGYRRATDELPVQHALPPSVLTLARQLAGVGSDDPDATLSYALDADAARRIGGALGAELDASLDYFLEPVGENRRTGRTPPRGGDGLSRRSDSSDDGSRESSHMRAVVERSTAGEPPRKGGILAALRGSPLVASNLDLTRSREAERKVDM